MSDSSSTGPDPDELPEGKRDDSEHDDPAGERLGERLTQQLAAQWALIRAERQPDPVPAITGGASNFSRAQVPWGLDLAAAWSWRVLVIGAGVYVIAKLMAMYAVVTLSLAIALLIAALVTPMRDVGTRIGIPRSLSSFTTVIVTFGAIGLLLTFAGQQVANGAVDLADEVVKGLAEIRVWLRDGPLQASDSQINDYIAQIERAISNWSQDAAVVSQVTSVGTAIGHVTAGFFIVLFAIYFFLADGERIWAWVVRLAPRAARTRVDSSGRVAWTSLTQFVRATVVVAFVDAVGIMFVAWLLGVPFVLAIGVLVFLGAFIPLIGATVAGSVAVLVALVDQGPWAALLMLIGVIVVQQIEGNVLQPFLMGRFVAIHPLGILVVIALGLLMAGVGGALIAVPLAAAVNAVVLHLNGEATLEELARTQAEQERVEADPGAEGPATGSER